MPCGARTLQTLYQLWQQLRPGAGEVMPTDDAECLTQLGSNERRCAEHETCQQLLDLALQGAAALASIGAVWLSPPPVS